ncbi:HutD family protein [Acetonema longum]|uniref:HutD-family protein n=1 Tax=Acetonema longum DSM 6540 TaxID=1009370 RepID=F7NHF4_9FIRM|nr:HutD family protein [Acetonema longum]EGO64501.1 hypothetical protein ALO_07498 [Acetonema longum DSM 6540]
MKLTRITADAAATTSWSGGISKQYVIYPPESSYANRDFSYRLSMAVAYSDAAAKYSKLENITRHLVMLEGTAQVCHKGHYDLLMHPYQEIDVFDGGWDSSGTGKVTDFNLMLGPGAHGRMAVIEQDGTIGLGGCGSCGKPYNRMAFFCGCGSAFFAFAGSEQATVLQHDLLLLEGFPEGLSVTISLAGAKLIRMDICCR